jgi:hypothetical protein
MRDARGRPSGRTWQAVRALILDRDGYRCQIELPVICVGDADQVDHEIPIVMGGSDAAGNLRAACRPCNSRPNVGRAEWPPRPARAVADLTPRQLDMVAELDRLGLPDTIGRTAVLRYLREHGVAAGIGSRTLDRACQYRGSRT